MLILIVDDEPLVRRQLRRELEHLGHGVIEAQDGYEGLACMRWVPSPELVMLDMVLGPTGMTGWEVAKTKTADAEIRDIPLLVMSVMTGAEVRAQAYRQDYALAGAVLFLDKPIDTVLLRNAVRAIQAGIRSKE